jgi:hypothetical protein
MRMLEQETMVFVQQSNTPEEFLMIQDLLEAFGEAFDHIQGVRVREFIAADAHHTNGLAGQRMV